MVEEMTALLIRVHRHVLLGARERTTSGDGADKVPKFGGVQGIAQGEQVREERDLLGGKVVERRKVARLFDL